MKKTMKLCALLTVFFMIASHSSNAQCTHGSQSISCHSSDGNQYNDIWQLNCPTGHLYYYIDLDVSGGGTASAAIWGDGPNLSDGIAYDSVHPLNNHKVISDNLSGLGSSLWIEAQATGTNGVAHASVTTW